MSVTVLTGLLGHHDAVVNLLELGDGLHDLLPLHVVGLVAFTVESYANGLGTGRLVGSDWRLDR